MDSSDVPFATAENLARRILRGMNDFRSRGSDESVERVYVTGITFTPPMPGVEVYPGISEQNFRSPFPWSTENIVDCQEAARDDRDPQNGAFCHRKHMSQSGTWMVRCQYLLYIYILYQ